jgi:Glycosyltransferase
MSVYNVDSGGGINSWLEEVAPRLGANNRVTLLTTNRGTRWASVSRNLPNVTLLEYPLLGWGRGGFLRGLLEVFQESDVVYLCSNSSLFARSMSLLGSRSAGKPLIAGHHNEMGQHRHEYSPTMLKLGGPLLDTLMNAHHALNEGTVAWLREIKARRIYKIPNGVNTGSFRTGDKRARFTLLFVGRLTPQKGVDLIPAIISELIKHDLDFEFHVGGDGPLRGLVSSLAEGGCGRVVWHGYVSEDEKRELYASSHVLVAPSRMEAFLSWVLRLWLLVRLWWRVIFLVRVSM